MVNFKEKYGKQLSGTIKTTVNTIHSPLLRDHHSPHVDLESLDKLSVRDVLQIGPAAAQAPGADHGLVPVRVDGMDSSLRSER